MLLDPSFDDTTSLENLTHWQYFIEPGPNAYSSLSPIAHSGRLSAHLSTPEKYESEPYNNWSQVIREIPEADRFWLSGNIRTEGNAKASLWVQCFQKSPLKVIKAEFVSAQSIESWKRIRLSIQPPESVDFIMVRCVIEGAGQAWFDSLVFSDDADEHLLETDLVLLEDFEENPVAQHRLQLENESALDVIEAAETMKELVKKLAIENEEVLSRLDTIQKDLRAFKRNALTQALEADTLEPLRPVYSSHPLVPFGYRDDSLKEN